MVREQLGNNAILSLLSGLRQSRWMRPFFNLASWNRTGKKFDLVGNSLSATDCIQNRLILLINQASISQGKMLRLRMSWLLAFTCLQQVASAAESLDDFTNNLFSDLAP